MRQQRGSLWRIVWRASKPFSGRRQLFLEVHDLLYLHEGPAIDFGKVENLFDTEAGAKGVTKEKNALGIGDAQFAGNNLARENIPIPVNFSADAPRFAVAAQAAAANFQGAQTLLQTLLEGAANGHGFANGFHLGIQSWIGLGKFLESEPGHFSDHIVDSRFETGRGFAGDIVSDLVEQVAYGKFGRDFGNGEPRRLGGQRAG